MYLMRACMDVFPYLWEDYQYKQSEDIGSFELLW